MALVTAAALAVALAATFDVPAGADIAAALRRAKPGDVVRLGPGEHCGSLGRLAGIRVEGAGALATRVVAPEGEDGAVAVGSLELDGLAIHAGPARSALEVVGGAAKLRNVALEGGACGALVTRGRLDGRDVELRGEHGLMLESGEVTLEGGSASGGGAGLSIVGGTLLLRRFDVFGPSEEAGIAVARGSARLEGVVVRAPGPTGISVSGGGRVEGFDVTVAGSPAQGDLPRNCVQSIGGSVRLEGATLVRCAGAAVEASGGEVALAATDATGGSAGCIVLVNRASANLVGNVCAGRGPGLVAASGAHARTSAGRRWTDPVLWVDCASGARVEVGRGERTRRPCAP